MEFQPLACVTVIAMNHKGMHYSLGSRELIADSIEVSATAHPFDAIVMVPNCDKIVPGHAHGCGSPQYPGHFCQRRPYAGRTSPQ